MKLFAALVMVFYICSCQKEAEMIPVKIKYLKREVSFTAAGPNIKEVRLFTYDSRQRVSKIEIGKIDSSVSNPQFAATAVINLHYKDTTGQPDYFSMVRTALPNVTKYYYWKYEAKGLKVRDSVHVVYGAGQESDRLITYTYTDRNIYVTPTEIGTQGGALTTDSLTLADGNITVHKSVLNGSVNTYTYAYDDKHNPYHVLNIAGSLYLQNSTIGAGYNVPKETHYAGFNKNNMLSYTVSGTSVLFNHVYDTDNYPVKKTMVINNAVQQTFYFEY